MLSEQPDHSHGRIAARFEALRRQGRAGLVTFIMAGDPDYDASLALMKALPAAGADVIELGVAFSDPTADGPAIQEAGLRALKAGITLRHTLRMVAEFRRQDSETPIVLMGYFNPIGRYGVHQFAVDAAKAGVDGLIVVDLPPEEDEQLRIPALAAGLQMIRLATPTTDDARIGRVLSGAGGFLYYVAVNGTTGSASAGEGVIEQAVTRLRGATRLPLAVGFGIRNAGQAASVARVADAAVVGTALVERMASEGGPGVLALVGELSQAVRQARQA
jgi:tryptophan synthase alpha chain